MKPYISTSKTHLTRLFFLSTINPIKKANKMNNNVLNTIKIGNKT
jgi:hypothetical protein